MGQGSPADAEQVADISRFSDDDQIYPQATPSETALLRANWQSWSFAVTALDDDGWTKAIADVRAGTRTAEDVARAYAHQHQARERLAELVEVVAAVPEGDAERWELLAAVGTIRTGAIAAPPPAGLPRNAIQRRTTVRHQSGVKYILRRGAGLCIRCGAQAPEKRVVRVVLPEGSTYDRVAPRPDYCEDCSDRRELQRPERHAIEGVLDELAADDPRGSRATTRRQHRATPRADTLTDASPVSRDQADLEEDDIRWLVEATFARRAFLAWRRRSRRARFRGTGARTGASTG